MRCTLLIGKNGICPGTTKFIKKNSLKWQTQYCLKKQTILQFILHAKPAETHANYLLYIVFFIKHLKHIRQNLCMVFYASIIVNLLKILA